MWNVCETLYYLSFRLKIIKTKSRRARDIERLLISTTMEMQVALVSICWGPTFEALEENEV